MTTKDTSDVLHVNYLDIFKQTHNVRGFHFILPVPNNVSDEALEKGYRCLYGRFMLSIQSCDMSFANRYPEYHKIITKLTPDIIEKLANRVETLEQEVKELKERLDGKERK